MTRKITADELAVVRLDLIEARERYMHLGMLNQPKGYEARLKSQVEYQLAYEDYRLADATYRKALERVIEQLTK